MSTTGNPACPQPGLVCCPGIKQATFWSSGGCQTSGATLARADRFSGGMVCHFQAGLLDNPSPSSPKPVCSLGPGFWGPFPSRCSLPAPHPLQQQVNAVGAGPQPGQLWPGGGWRPRLPLPGPGCPLCSDRGCPAARSLARAHIPAVTLRVSGLELLSVRGPGFSQRGRFLGTGTGGEEAHGDPRVSLCTDGMLPGAGG